MMEGENKQVFDLMKSKKKKQPVHIEENENPVNLVFNELIEECPEALYDFYFRTEAETFVLYEFENQFYVPEVEILKLAFKYLLSINLNVVKLRHDSFFKGKLPILRINDTFFQKDEFIDFLLKILCDNKKENCFAEIFMINAIRKTLHHCTQYFTWVNPPVNYHYRDPYWLILSPIKKFSHFFSLKNLKEALEFDGIRDPITAISKASQVFQIIARFKHEKEIVTLRADKERKSSLVDFVIYCYLKEILQNPRNCQKLIEDLQENYHSLIDFVDVFEEKIDGNGICISANFETKLILLERKPAKKDISKLENEQTRKRNLLKKGLISAILLSVFSVVYYKVE